MVRSIAQLTGLSVDSFSKPQKDCQGAEAKETSNEGSVKLPINTLGLAGSLGLSYYILSSDTVKEWTLLPFRALADCVAHIFPSISGASGPIADAGGRIFIGLVGLKLLSEPSIKRAYHHIQAASNNLSSNQDRLKHSVTGLFFGVLALLPLTAIYQMYQTFPAIES